MSKVVIYRQSTGVVAVFYPSADAVLAFGLDVVAKRAVPSGLPYKIIDADSLPADRSARAAWEVDDAELTDGVGEYMDADNEVGQ